MFLLYSALSSVAITNYGHHCVPFVHSGIERTDRWSSAPGPDEVAPSEKLDDVWRPIIGPGEVTVTDITLNSLTVTFRESRVARGFFRGWGLEV